jgi:signal transduction histidine kinase
VLHDGDTVLVQVSDQGMGIAAADLPRLFTRFGRVVTRENSHIAGTGLGLYLSRELARMHGGDITVESEPGRGSVFTLCLPRSDAHVLRPAIEQ